jgi:hypothetical protein
MPRSRRQEGSRSCFGCTECCTALAVEGVPDAALAPQRKGAGERCPYQSPVGCIIYDSRPEACRAYRCAWLADDLQLSNSMRPDRSRIVIDIGLAQVAAGMGLAPHDRTVHLRPMDSKALNRKPELVRRLVREHVCLVMVGETTVCQLGLGDTLDG